MDCLKTESGEVAVACPPDDSVSGQSDMDCPKAESGEVAVARLPDDSVVDILSRLHAKPLFRFKCVSKDWCSLITDCLRCRNFPQVLEGFFAGDEVESYGRFIGRRRPVPLVDPSFSFLPKLPEGERFVLLDSCNGLVLFEHRRVSEDMDISHISLGFTVCNPATEEWVSVPGDNFYGEDVPDDDSSDTYLVFDPAISPHFRLIQLRKDCFGGSFSDLVDVLHFSSETGRWGLQIEDAPEGIQVGRGVCLLNGMLHMVAHRGHPENQDMVLAVGWEGSPFRTLHWPANDRGVLVFVGQSQGQLHCLSGYMTEDNLMTELSIWVLEDYNAEKWVLRDNVSLSPLFKRTGGCGKIVELHVVTIHPYRSLVFFGDFSNCKLIAYDMDKMEVYSICSLRGYHRPIIPYVPYFTSSLVLAKEY